MGGVLCKEEVSMVSMQETKRMAEEAKRMGREAQEAPGSRPGVATKGSHSGACSQHQKCYAKRSDSLSLAIT
jgi:hypothetical protein